jgi:hypothetical protein
LLKLLISNLPNADVEMENEELYASQENSAHMEKYMDYSDVKFLKCLKTNDKKINLKDCDIINININNENYYENDKDNNNKNENNNNKKNQYLDILNKSHSIIYIEDNLDSFENKK